VRAVKVMRLNVRVEPDLHRHLLREAAAKSLSVSDVIRLAIINTYGRKDGE